MNQIVSFYHKDSNFKVQSLKKVQHYCQKEYIEKITKR